MNFRNAKLFVKQNYLQELEKHIHILLRIYAPSCTCCICKPQHDVGLMSPVSDSPNLQFSVHLLVSTTKWPVASSGCYCLITDIKQKLQITACHHPLSSLITEPVQNSSGCYSTKIKVSAAMDWKNQFDYRGTASCLINVCPSHC